MCARSGRSRPPPAATPRTAAPSSREAERICRTPDRRAVGQARGASHRARRRLRHPSARTASSAISAAARSNWSTCTARACARGVTLPLGGLALQDIAGKSLKKAEKIVAGGARRRSTCCTTGEGRTFYAVGGTWRALARLHMWQTGYPLHVMHDYRHPGARGAGVLAAGAPGRHRDAVADRSRQRRAPAAARLCRAGAGTPGAHRSSRSEVVISALGVREGLLYSLLERERARARSADRRRRRSQRAALALAASRRGADRLDRPLHGVVRARRDRRGAAAAPRRLPARPTSAGARIPTIAASSR